jgi:signal transduction histidine kinase/CheY-like chemotaxis protein
VSAGARLSPPMKPSKSPRIGLPQRGRSSRSTEVLADQQSPSRDEPHILASAGRQKSSGRQSSAIDTTTMPRDARELEAMRKKMNEALAQKQLQIQNASTSPESTTAVRSSPEKSTPQAYGTELAPVTSDESLPSGTHSTDSTKTIRAPLDTPNVALRTPSYPFPRMNLRLNRMTSHRSGPSHKPFTLLSPTNAPPDEGQSTPRSVIVGDSSETSPPMEVRPGDATIEEDPNFPTPDLYSMILMLSSEPGLDSWWANVTQVLSEAYGAERASLALPGDMTDLENVPWGQRATFNIYGSESSGSSRFESSTASIPDLDGLASIRRFEPQQTIHDVVTTTQTRPSLQSRHSIAGPVPDTGARGTRQRPAGPLRALSNISAHHDDDVVGRPASPRVAGRSPVTRSGERSENDSPMSRPPLQSSASVSSLLRCVVHRGLIPLESEPDPLLVRTGVAALFGKRKPVVLTRAYTEDDVNTSAHSTGFFVRDNPRDRPELHTRTPSGASQDGGSQGNLRFLRAFDEYEQPEPSAWSQSPAPSPAARPDPSESPFFAQIGSVDETAFETDPPPHDYAATANQSLNAIGIDSSKTLIHIPLVQPSRGLLNSSLRFPVAILSILTPINPYPRNLRHSLSHLLPHLASSFSLAQQYSALYDRTKGPMSQRHRSAFGLGGTFSDEGSELELVAELSSELEKDKSSNYSPSDRTSTSRGSPGGSAVGTPYHDQMGFRPGLPPTPSGRSGSEMVDSYFTAKRQKTSGQPSTPSAGPSSDEVVRKSSQKSQLTSRGQGKKVAISSTTRHEDQRMPSPSRRASMTTESDNGDMSEKTDGKNQERPLPELISQLMLNSVPLQLFLAKPRSGDLVWTNRKFDAFRSQGDERVKDPWKNVHDSDRPALIKGWNEILKSGSQFTHYVRVKRFNSDSDFRWFIFRASTLLSANGRLLYWIGSFMDVHEQYIKNIEANEKEATVARDAKLRAIADAIPQILFEALEGEGIVSVNHQWHAFSGQSLEEARGLGFAKHVHREDLFKCGVLSPSDAATVSSLPSTDASLSSSSSSSTTTIQPLQRLARFTQDTSSLDRLVDKGIITVERDENNRVSYSTEVRLRSKGGEFRWFLVRLVKVETRGLLSGRASWYGTCTDIDIRKGLERELSRANKKVHSEMESKTKFFANMSHEIRTPLNGILGSMPWLVESNLDHDQRRTVDTIQNSSNNLRELVDNILDVTKVEAGKMNLVYKWFHIRTLLEEIIDTVSSRAIERGLQLNYTVDANVPGTVKGDPFRLRQVLLNLMGNSVKFTEQGEVYTHCSVRLPSPSSGPEANHISLLFDVVDTGRGFNETEFQRLFKQFGQLDGGSNHDAGSGLGLFLSKQLVEMHGGKLSAKSQAGEGSTFSFYITVEVADTNIEVTSPILRSKQRGSASFATSPRSRSDSKTPMMSMTRGIASPSASSFPVASPATMSPAIRSSGSSDPSIQSVSNAVVSSSMSSIPTSDSTGPAGTQVPVSTAERQAQAEKAMAGMPSVRRSSSEVTGGSAALPPSMAHPTMYSIVVICPAEHARAAIRQHIEQVVPHQIAVNVTAVADIGAFSALVSGPTSPSFTHIVLDLPHSSDIMLFMRQMIQFTATVIPSLVVITDHYQKRDILEDFNRLIAAGRRAYLVHKPVKPSVFAMIFDPAQLRYLSKDRVRDMAQTSSDDFKNIAETVKRTVGNRAFRLLLVEDSDINRMVIMRYLKKVELACDEATNGLEATEKVLGRPHGYYSLIICDIQMPKKNGYEACADIRAWERSHGHPPTPIMALTANAMPEERAAAGQAGFTDYLTKPVDFNVLGPMMMKLLDSRVPHVFLKDQPADSG